MAEGADDCHGDFGGVGGGVDGDKIAVAFDGEGGLDDESDSGEAGVGIGVV